jgi:Tol biopolymer transport system component
MKDREGLWGVYVTNIYDRVPHQLPTKLRETSDPEWSHNGKWIYFRAYEGVGHQLYRCPAQGGDALLLAASQDLVQPTESADGKVLYFLSREADAIMMMLPLDRPGAAPQPVQGMPNVSFEHRWMIASDGIYFVSQSTPHTLSFYDFSTQKARDIFKTDRDLHDGISISPDGCYLLFSQLDENDSNIMLVSNFH